MWPTISPLAGFRTASVAPAAHPFAADVSGLLEERGVVQQLARDAVFERSASAMPSSYRRAAAFCAQDIGRARSAASRTRKPIFG